MRLATFSHQGNQRAGLVVRHPRDGADWVFVPSAVMTAAARLPALKGAGYTWWRPDFAAPGEIAWPESLAAWLALGPEAMQALRRMQDFLQNYLAQGDPLILGDAGWPLDSVRLLAPLPEPRLLLGIVGNNAGFLRMDPARARNLHQPSCHQRTQTSIVGPGQPITLPAGGESFAGTTELGVIIGRGGRDIPRERAREHIAGYTVVNDGLGSLYARRWAELDRAAGVNAGGPLHFHSVNSASWLDKKSDTMLAMGPWMVTPDEVGDPYDRLCWYRESGLTRDRGHTGAMVSGIEETIHWLSGFITLEPGMVIHFGALGRDGLPAANPEGSVVECEIERVGVLRNPLRREVRDPLAAAPPARDPSPAPAAPRHFWTPVANTRAAASRTGIMPRSYPLVYNAPPTALAGDGAVLRLPSTSGTLTATCELGVVIGRRTKNLSPDAVAGHLAGYVVLLALRDSCFASNLAAPHLLPANMPEIYSRWPDGFNVMSKLSPALAALTDRPMRIEVGSAQATAVTSDYLLGIGVIVAELSRGVTLLPGDIVALGETAATLTLPDRTARPPSLRLRAVIEGLGEVSASLPTS